MKLRPRDFLRVKDTLLAEPATTPSPSPSSRSTGATCSGSSDRSEIWNSREEFDAFGEHLMSVEAAREDPLLWCVRCSAR